jgi:hypothetical protein
VLNKVLDFADEITHTAKRPSLYCLLRYDAEPAFNLIEP